MVSRTLLLILTLVLGMALLSLVQNSMPLVLDIIVLLVEFFAKVSFAVIGLAILLAVIVSAGAWITLVGMRMDAQPTRVRGRRRSRA